MRMLSIQMSRLVVLPLLFLNLETLYLRVVLVVLTNNKDPYWSQTLMQLSITHVHRHKLGGRDTDLFLFITNVTKWRSQTPVQLHVIA